MSKFLPAEQDNTLEAHIPAISAYPTKEEHKPIKFLHKTRHTIPQRIYLFWQSLFLTMFDGTQLALERKFPRSNSEKDRIPQMDSS
jgi:hypothetical protein